MDKRNLIAVFLVALIIRGGVSWLTPDALRADPDGYRQLAENLLAHGTFGDGNRPTAYRPPLYPLLLSGCVALGENDQRLAIGLLHALMGAATSAMVYVLARRWGLSARAAMLAAALVILDPILLNQSAQIMTETAAAFFTTAGLLAISCLLSRIWRGAGGEGQSLPSPACGRGAGGEGQSLPSPACGRGAGGEGQSLPSPACGRGAGGEGQSLPSPACGRGAGGEGIWRCWLTLLSGIVFGLGALCRPTLLLWTAAVGAMLFIHCYKNSRRPAASGGIAGCSYICLPAAFILGAILALAPWAIRNQAQFGRPVITTTHGGYTLLLANNPSFYQWLREGRWGSVWPAEEFNAAWLARRPADELQADRLAYSEARAAIAAEPGMFAWSCLVRVGRFWSPLAHQVVEQESPARRAARWSAAAWYALVFLAAIIFLIRQGLGTLVPGKMSDKDAIGCNICQPRAIDGWPWGLLLLACLTAVHAVYWTDMRMRAPAMPAVALLAAAGLPAPAHRAKRLLRSRDMEIK